MRVAPNEGRIIDGCHDRPRRATGIAGFVVRFVEDNLVVLTAVEGASKPVHRERFIPAESRLLQ